MKSNKEMRIVIHFLLPMLHSRPLNFFTEKLNLRKAAKWESVDHFAVGYVQRDLRPILAEWESWTR